MMFLPQIPKGSHPKALNFTFELKFAFEQSKQNPPGPLSSKSSTIIKKSGRADVLSCVVYII